MIITGTIQSEGGELLEYANVYVSNADGIKTGLSTVTNELGRYSLVANNNDYITATYVGYKKQIKNAASSVNFLLEEITSTIGDVDIEDKKPKNKFIAIGSIMILAGTAIAITQIINNK